MVCASAFACTKAHMRTLLSALRTIDVKAVALFGISVIFLAVPVSTGTALWSWDSLNFLCVLPCSGSYRR